MAFNPDNFREDIASLNLTEQQEDELLYTLYEIMRTFAEMGHGVHSINSIFPEIFETADQASHTLPDSEDTLQVTFNDRKD